MDKGHKPSQTRLLVDVSSNVNPFRAFFERRISFSDYVKLRLKMGQGRGALICALNNPKGMNLEVLREMSQLLKVHPFELVEKYGAATEAASFLELQPLQKEFLELKTKVG